MTAAADTTSVGLTSVQGEALRFIARYMRDRRLSPTLAEIRDHMGYRSNGRVHAILVALRERGRITWRKGVWRSIELVDVGEVKLPGELQLRLAEHCAVTGDAPGDVVADALALHFDALAGEVADAAAIVAVLK